MFLIEKISVTADTRDRWYTTVDTRHRFRRRRNRQVSSWNRTDDSVRHETRNHFLDSRFLASSFFDSLTHVTFSVSRAANPRWLQSVATSDSNVKLFIPHLWLSVINDIHRNYRRITRQLYISNMKESSLYATLISRLSRQLWGFRKSRYFLKRTRNVSL